MNINLYNLINSIENDFSTEDAYSLYIEFCFKVIDRIENRLSDDIKNTVQLAKDFWVEYEVDAQKLEDARVGVLKRLDKAKFALHTSTNPEIKLAILPLWTSPPSTDISDSFEWSIMLLNELRINKKEILEILLPIYVAYTNEK